MIHPAKSYYRVMLGRQSAHAAECLAGDFIGADFGIGTASTITQHHHEIEQFLAVLPSHTRVSKAPLLRWTMIRSCAGRCSPYPPSASTATR